MNGRVRWEPRYEDDGSVASGCVNLAGHTEHVLTWNADGTPGCAAVVGDEPARFYRQRRTAQAWLLARAAGLAEVPPRRFNFVSRYARLAVEDAEPRRPPRGWRLFDVDRGTLFDVITGEIRPWVRSYYERNRRRR